MSYDKITNETDITGFLTWEQKQLLTPEQREARKKAFYEARLSRLGKSPRILLTNEEKSLNLKLRLKNGENLIRTI